MFPSGAPDAQEVSTFPNTVIEEPNVFIPLPDGIKLAARMWRAVTDKPVPAIIECIPYRKRDATSIDDERIHPYFAGHGYAALRIDLRGSGDSDGVLMDEYLPSEQDDLCAVIQWLSEQPWCNGSVGMMGISWGGFNSLQVAIRQPKPLKAVIAVGATVDRYHDDVHYKGGAILNEHFGWAATSLSFMSRPPDPTVRPDWKALWQHRLENQPFVAENWFSHQERDAYWRQGSVCEDYSLLTTPVLAVTGWADAYVNFVGEIMANAPGPRKGIIGPWPHAYPHIARPGPTIGFLQEAVRWWDYWLKEEDTGIMDEPQMRVYCQTHFGANPHAECVPGKWLAETSWPSAKVTDSEWHLRGGSLTDSPDLNGAGTHVLLAPADNGVECGEYIPHCSGPEIGGDQRADDAYALCFDTKPLSKNMVIHGRPRLSVRVSVNTPKANLIARLCEVDKYGVSQRVSYGVLNLTHRSSHDLPSAVPIDELVNASIDLNQCCHEFTPGNRIRVSVTTAYWPLIWPSPDTPTLTLEEESSSLRLPVRTSNHNESEVRFEPAVFPGPVQQEVLSHASQKREVTRDLTSNLTYHHLEDSFGTVRYSHGLTNTATAVETYSIDRWNPETAMMSKNWVQEFTRDDWQARTETHAELRCDANWFYIDASLVAYANGELLTERKWQNRFPRQFV